MPLPVTPDQIRAAHERIRSHVLRTPLLPLGPTKGAEVIFKLELVQHAGSFKTRGAFNTLLSRTVPPAGVTAASGGNHGVAVARGDGSARGPFDLREYRHTARATALRSVARARDRLATTQSRARVGRDAEPVCDRARHVGVVDLRSSHAATHLRPEVS